MVALRATTWKRRTLGGVTEPGRDEPIGASAASASGSGSSTAVTRSCTSSIPAHRREQPESGIQILQTVQGGGKVSIEKLVGSRVESKGDELEASDDHLEPVTHRRVWAGIGCRPSLA